MSTTVTIDPRFHDAVIFDLDGVVTDTASIHAAAWAALFNDFLQRRKASDDEDHSPFTDDDYRHFVDGKARGDGVTDFLASRGISLPPGSASDSTEDTICGLGARKQEIFLKGLHAGVPVFESTVGLVRKLALTGVAVGVYSSSRNCERILKDAGLGDLFTVRVDGVVAQDLELPGKPDPAVLLETTRRLGAVPERSVVVEDAEAGVEAGSGGGFALVIGVDRTGHGEELRRHGADVVVPDLVDVAVRTGDKPMSLLPNAVDSYGQLIGVVGGRQPFVCLDFDGTLSEIVSDPDAARLVDGAAKALENLAAHCPVAILSGRDLADVRDRIGIPGIWYAGSHGFELIGPDGSHHHNDAADAAVPILESAAAELNDALKHVPGAYVEHKRYAVAVHFRNVSPDRVAEVVATTHRHGQRHGLRVTGGRKVVELRPDIDWDKGSALAWIRDLIHETGRVLPIYVGDDLTDEDAFDAIRFNGIGVVVRHDEDGDRPTSAQFTLNNPDEVQEFLRRGGSWLAYEQQTSNEAWTLTFDGYDPPQEKLREALCTVGNGYFATRGAAPESKAGQVHYPGTLRRGCVQPSRRRDSRHDDRARKPGESSQLAPSDVPHRRRRLVRRRRRRIAGLSPGARHSRRGPDPRAAFPRQRRSHHVGDRASIRRDARGARRRVEDDDHRRGLVWNSRGPLDARWQRRQLFGGALPRAGQHPPDIADHACAVAELGAAGG